MKQRRFAFLIGANGPESDRLKYAEKDVVHLADALKKSPCYFTRAEIVIAKDRSSTLAQLKHCAEQCEPSDLFLVHFSGHAVFDEQLYLLCNETDENDLISSALEISAVKTILRRCKARHKILILDCCHAAGAHSGALRSGQNLQEILQGTVQGSASVIFSACSRRARTRELDVLDGGAGFLSWVFITACTTYFQEASPDHKSLSLKDVCRWSDKALKMINGSLNEQERLPSPVLFSEQEGELGEEIWLTDWKRGGVDKWKDQEASLSRDFRLNALLANHTGFMRDRLESFIGRQKELGEIEHLIETKFLTGGYITITGQPGQGKSSLIAKLVDVYGQDRVAFHFIPFNPGPDHQLGLMRNLMARLILKHNLSDLYVASESRPVLRDYFPKVLEEIVTKGEKEVIFIDGLDQLEEEYTGIRDLSFLPNNPPAGIVFVLGTRPNDTLLPLELLTPHQEYKLPNLSRLDFDLILQRHKVDLKIDLADQLYQMMQENALYLNLAAKELVRPEDLSFKDIITRISNNPENLFSLAVNRLKRPSLEWREVIKPLLGILLAACEPLSLRQIRGVLNIEDDRLREGVARLGGLIADNGQKHYSLFHLKLQDFLRQNEQRSEKDYIFAPDEEEHWHAELARWCERGILSIIRDEKSELPNEQERQKYARKYLIIHLYKAQEWAKLFEILDTGKFGQMKIRYDPSMFSYAQDLDFGRQAAIKETQTQDDSFSFLTRLWRYTLLQCSLTSQADRYPLEAFQFLLALGRENEALGLAELLTESSNKAKVLFQIAKYLAEQLGRKEESVQLFTRVYEIACVSMSEGEKINSLRELGVTLTLLQEEDLVEKVWSEVGATVYTIKSNSWHASTLAELVDALIYVQQWDLAKTIVNIIEIDYKRVNIHKLIKALVKAEKWDQARSLAFAIEEEFWKESALCTLAIALAHAQQWEHSWEIVNTIKLSYWVTSVLCNLGVVFAEIHQLKRAVEMWSMSEVVANKIGSSLWKARAFCELGAVLAQYLPWKQAEAVWSTTEAVVHTIEEDSWRDDVLGGLGIALAQAQQWNWADAVINTIEDDKRKSDALYNLSIELAKLQQWDRAESVINNLDDKSFRKENAICELINALVISKQWDRAERVANIIGDWRKKEVLQTLGVAFAQAQQWHRVETVVHIIDESTEILSSLHAEKDTVLFSLGEALIQAHQWKKAEIAAQTIKSSSQRARLLSLLGTAMIQEQHREDAETILLQVKSAVRMVERDYDKDGSLWKLIEGLIKIRQWDYIEGILRMDGVNKEGALRQLLHALILSHEWDHAERIVRTMDRSHWQDVALRELTTELAIAQEWERAEVVACSIEGSYEKAYALQGLGTALVQVQEWERAKAVWLEAEIIINAIEDEAWRDQALQRLGTCLAKENQWEYAEKIIHMIKKDFYSSRAWKDIAVALAQTQQWERAQTIAHSIKEDSERAQALGELGTALALAQQMEQAEFLWNEAEAVIASMQSRYEKLNTLRILEIALARAQQWERAEQLVKYLVAENHMDDLDILKEFAEALFQAQQWKRAEHLAYAVKNSFITALLLKELGVALARIQQWDYAETIIRKIEDSAERAGGFSLLGELLAKSRLYDRAETMWSESEAIIYTEDGVRISALNTLGEAFARAGQWQRAETVANMMPEGSERAQVLCEIARIFAENKEYEQLLSFVQRSWLQARTRNYCTGILSLAVGFIPLRPEFGVDLGKAFSWVDNFLKA